LDRLKERVGYRRSLRVDPSQGCKKQSNEQD